MGMNKITLAAAALLTLSPLSFASSSLPVISDKDFVQTVNEALLPFQAKDAFAQAGSCGIVDAKTIRPFTIDEAISGLQPCLFDLSSIYEVRLALKVDADGLVIEAESAAAGMSLLRDLGYGLQGRQNRLLGYPVKVRRGLTAVRQSRVQAMVDGCITTMALRRIDSGADFLQVYGGCLSRERSIKAVRPSEGQKLGLTLLVAGEQPEVESLNGIVRVPSLDGMVELLVVAYPEKIALP
jgi:hypothetical protein